MGLISKLLGQNTSKKPAGLSIGGKISLGYTRTQKEDIYAHQFSCMNRDEDCNFCKRLDGAVIATDDPIIKHLISDKDPDEQHPFGYKTKTFERLCSCKACGCIWVDILKDEEMPPSIEMSEDLRNEISKAIS